MAAKAQMLQDPFLNALRKERVQVAIYLVNGIKLQGHVDAFDQYVILLKNTVTQMVYKHAISTIVPSKSVAFPQTICPLKLMFLDHWLVSCPSQPKWHALIAAAPLSV